MISPDVQEESTSTMSTILVDVTVVLLALVLFVFIHVVIVRGIIGMDSFLKRRQRASRRQVQMEQLGVLHQMGELQKRFDQQDYRAPFTIVGVICAPVGFFLLLSPWMSDIGDLLVHAWGAIWITACLVPAIVSLKRRRVHIGVYTAGLILLKGDQTVIARWDQIEKFWKIVSIGRSGDSSDSYEYKIQLSDGALYRFTDNLSPSVSQLGRQIEQQVTRLLLPPVIARCDGGAEMSWDGGLRVRLSQLGVDRDSGHDMSLPLDEVEAVTLDEEQLSIVRKDQKEPWYRQRVATIANVAVFKGLVDHLLKERARSQLPKAIATYQAGIPMVCGRVVVSRQGIEVDQGKKRLSWPEVSSVEVTDQKVSIHSRRETIWTWQRIDRWMVPDALLLQELTAYLLQEQGQPSPSPSSAEIGKMP
jgi:hypothetical protein